MCFVKYSFDIEEVCLFYFVIFEYNFVIDSGLFWLKEMVFIKGYFISYLRLVGCFGYY